MGQKQQINGIFVSQRDPAETVYDIAMLTSGWSYIEYEIRVLSPVLTPFLVDRLTGLFGQYQMCRATRVFFSDTVGKDSAVFQYLKILGSAIGFKLQRRSVDDVIQRISDLNVSLFGTYVQGQGYKPANISKRDLQSLWRKISESGKCPWITNRYGEYLKTLSWGKRFRKQLVRLSAFYIVLIAKKTEKDRNSPCNRATPPSENG